MSTRNLTAKNLLLISAEIAGQEIQMDIFAYSQCKSRHVGAFKTPEAIASDVPDSRIMGSGNYELGSSPRDLHSVTRSAGTHQRIL